MRVVVAGGNGVVGRHLIALLRAGNHSVTLLTRGDRSGVRWSPRQAAAGEPGALGTVASALDGADAVVNLAGASLGDGRLDAAHKARVLDSRLDSTRALVLAHAECSKPPPVWLQASAVGYYGNAGEAVVDESAVVGRDFLATTCAAWESTARAVESRTRLVIMRIGLVLASDAPAWQKMLLPMKLGIGGRLGSGEQWMAWIDAEDLAQAMLFLIGNAKAHGVYNLAAPEPVRQIDLARQTAARLRRPAIVPAPAFLLRLLVGEAADLLVLGSCRAVPSRLQELGFRFAQSRFAEEVGRIV